MISVSQWQTYRNIINKAHDSFSQDNIIWHRYSRGFQRYGEDTKGNENCDDIVLKCLIGYNFFKTLPITKETASGALDGENIVLMLNKKYLEDLGYLNNDNFFDMDPGKDSFTHRGLKYRAAGETEVAQAGNEPLMFYVILKREETETGEAKY